MAHFCNFLSFFNLTHQPHPSNVCILTKFDDNGVKNMNSVNKVFPYLGSVTYLAFDPR
jgi:hypothetical protein